MVKLCLILSIVINIFAFTYLSSDFLSEDSSKIKNTEIPDFSSNLGIVSVKNESKFVLDGNGFDTVPDSENIDSNNVSYKTEKVKIKERNRALLDIIKNNKDDITNGLLFSIEEGVFSVNDQVKSTSRVYTPFLAALAIDKDISLEQVKRFTELGAVVENDPIWSVAISSKSPEIIQELINNGFDPNTTYQSLPMVYQAFFLGNLEAVRYLESIGYYLDDNIDIKRDKGNGEYLEFNVDLKNEINKRGVKNSEELLNFLNDRGRK